MEADGPAAAGGQAGQQRGGQAGPLGRGGGVLDHEKKKMVSHLRPKDFEMGSKEFRREFKEILRGTQLGREK